MIDISAGYTVQLLSLIVHSYCETAVHNIQIRCRSDRTPRSPARNPGPWSCTAAPQLLPPTAVPLHVRRLHRSESMAVGKKVVARRERMDRMSAGDDMDAGAVAVQGSSMAPYGSLYSSSHESTTTTTNAQPQRCSNLACMQMQCNPPVEAPCQQIGGPCMEATAAAHGMAWQPSVTACDGQ